MKTQTILRTEPNRVWDFFYFFIYIIYIKPKYIRDRQ